MTTTDTATKCGSSELCNPFFKGSIMARNQPRRVVGQESGGDADVIDGHKAARERLLLGLVEQFVEFWDAGRGPCRQWPRRNGVNADTLKSVREHQAGLQSFRSMRRIDARRKNASALRLRFSQSLASLRQRLSQAMVLSTTQRRGNTINPFA